VLPAVSVTRKEVLQLYKSFMRVAALWHYDEARKQRLLKTWMKQAVRTSFKEHKDESDPQKISQLIKYGGTELSALKKIQNNVYNTSYPLVYKIVPDLVRKSKELLSDASQDKISKGKWGFFDRIKGLYYIFSGK